MYQRIPWELFADPFGSAEHTVRTTSVGSPFRTQDGQNMVCGCNYVQIYVKLPLILTFLCTIVRIMSRYAVKHLHYTVYLNFIS